MTQPKLKTLHKLITEFGAEMRSGQIFAQDGTQPTEADKEGYGAEAVALVALWVKRMME